MKQLTEAIDFHSKLGKKYHISQWLQSTFWLPTLYKISFLCST